ncbi:MAG: sigma-70 family RNA polymerase sigma factor [Chloroflexota bacterium]
MLEPLPRDLLDKLQDDELLNLHRGGDQAALEVLLGRHQDALVRYCHHLTANRHDAEDIYQEAMARAIARVDTLSSGDALRGWLFRIAHNLSVDSFRRGQRLQPMPEDAEATLPSQTAGPQDQVETREEHRIVKEVLASLKPSHRQVLMLREVEEMSYADIAERLNVSQSAVETLLFRARRRLKEQYGKAASAGVAVLAPLRSFALRLLSPLGGGAPAGIKILAAVALGGLGVAAISHVATNHSSVAHSAIGTPSLIRVTPPSPSSTVLAGSGSSTSSSSSSSSKPSRARSRRPHASARTSRGLASSPTLGPVAAGAVTAGRVVRGGSRCRTGSGCFSSPQHASSGAHTGSGTVRRTNPSSVLRSANAASAAASHSVPAGLTGIISTTRPVHSSRHASGTSAPGHPPVYQGSTHARGTSRHSGTSSPRPAPPGDGSSHPSPGAHPGTPPTSAPAAGVGVSVSQSGTGASASVHVSVHAPAPVPKISPIAVTVVVPTVPPVAGTVVHTVHVTPPALPTPQVHVTVVVPSPLPKVSPVPLPTVAVTLVVPTVPLLATPTLPGL